MGVVTDVSAVVVNYRSAALTVACVEHLREQGVGEVVVVDSASGDDVGTRLRAADPDARFLALGANRGYGAAANAGVALTTRPFVIVCNPDLSVHPGAIDALAARLASDPRLGAVGPRIDRPDGTRYPSARTFPSLQDAAGHGFLGLVTTENRWSRRYLRTDALEAGPVDWVSGAFMMLRREAFDAAGGFDERFFMFMEDVDLCWQLHHRGWGVEYEPAGRVVHLEGASRAWLPYRMILAHHRSLLRYGWRTASPRDRLLMPVVAVGLGVRTALLFGRTAANRIAGRDRGAGGGGGHVPQRFQ
jgi:N-acetylglucosaminyl-diphospho-decaprenol L-rhamnosyltransferase